MRDWVTNVETTHYLIGTVAGPHPFPAMVRDFQRVIGVEARQQVLELDGAAARRGRRLRRRRLQRDRHLPRLHPRRGRAAVRLRGGRRRRRAPAGTRPPSPAARRACCTAPAPTCCRTTTARPSSRTRSRAGLDYPGVGPEHAWLHDTGRAEYGPVTDAEAMEAFELLCRTEGIIPAIESAHALAGALVLAGSAGNSGRTPPDPGQPVRPRRQGRGDRRRRGSASATRGGRPRPGPGQRQSPTEGAVTQRRGRRRVTSAGEAREPAGRPLRQGPGRGPGRAGRLPAGRLPDVDGGDRRDDGDGRGGRGRHRDRLALLRPGHGRAGDPAGGRRRRRPASARATCCGPSRRSPTPAPARW